MYAERVVRFPTNEVYIGHLLRVTYIPTRIERVDPSFN